MKHSVEEYLRAILKNPLEDGWDENGEPPLCLIYQEVLKIINPFDEILEVGPGYGEFSLYLLNQGKKVEMLDIKEDDLVIMKKICEEKGYNYSFHLDDISTSKLSKTYDAVFAIEVVEHIEDYKDAILKMMSLAKYKVVLTTPVLNAFYDPSHKHFFLEPDFEFIKSYKIKKIITAKVDIPVEWKRVFLIEIDI